ncbi:hypothetical protein [Clostridium massiliodielmoense]|uniref:hypothetical protein n=1 Tax=Clostridium massiliodielmoense TaxID=1776385 RepID=UPI0004D46842|nr:hypothetical protein [Clostridium massiliodielmoense]KEH98064.1 hypothetical protein Z962_01030 [Clostridium botulinum C/D str. BKT12695]
MRDWKELALDDILSEMNNIVQEEEKKLNNDQLQSSPSSSGTKKISIPFCCVATIPGSFKVPGAQINPPQPQPGGSIPPSSPSNLSIAWNSCLNLRLERQNISVTACSSQAPCGSIPACVTKISGCIQFIASTPVQGNNTITSSSSSSTPSASNVCCKGCVCVDECVGCQLLQCAQPCPSNLGNFTISVANQNVCVQTCEPCKGMSVYPNSQTVKFTGNFIITYTAPPASAPTPPSPCGSLS